MTRPVAITPAVATRPSRLDVFVGRVNATLGEPWVKDDHLKGREVGVKGMAPADLTALVDQFRAAGWNVGVNEGRAVLLFHPSKV